MVGIFDCCVAAVKGVWAACGSGDVLIILWWHSFEVGLVELPDEQGCAVQNLKVVVCSTPRARFITV